MLLTGAHAQNLSISNFFYNSFYLPPNYKKFVDAYKYGPHWWWSMKNKRGGDGPRKVATGLYIALLLNIILFIFFVLNTAVH
jgi:hypothetical protein